MLMTLKAHASPQHASSGSLGKDQGSLSQLALAFRSEPSVSACWAVYGVHFVHCGGILVVHLKG